MAQKVDATGRPVLASEWTSIQDVPANLSQIGSLADPGAGSFLLVFDSNTNTWAYTTTFSGFIAASVSVVSPGAGWPATNVQDALDDITTAIDAIVAGAVLQSSGSFTATWSNGLPSATFTVFYAITGNQCTLHIRTNSVGTYVSGPVQFTGLPAACRPAHTKAVPCTYLQKNGVSENAGEVILANSTTVSLFLLALSGGNYIHDSSWSGTSGVEAGWSVTYDLT